MAFLALAHMGRDARHSGVDDVHVRAHSAAEHAPGNVPDRADKDVPVLLAVPDCWRRLAHIPLHIFEYLLQVSDLEPTHLGRCHYLQCLRPRATNDQGTMLTSGIFCQWSSHNF